MANKVKFIREVELKNKRTILQLSKDSDIKIRHPCGGKGKCGKCIVRVKSGQVSKPTQTELKILGKEKVDKGYRLACEAVIDGDAVIKLKK